jgi:hypothetical protein
VKIEIKLFAFGQLEEKLRDWVMPSAAGKISAITHAAQVTPRPRPGGDAAMNRSAV